MSNFKQRLLKQDQRHIWWGGGQGGGSPGEQGAGGVREAGEERAGGGISTMAGSGREIQKVKLFFCYCLLPVKETNPTTFLDFHLTFSEA